MINCENRIRQINKNQEYVSKVSYQIVKSEKK
jgi:hypothetical protein